MKHLKFMGSLFLVLGPLFLPAGPVRGVPPETPAPGRNQKFFQPPPREEILERLELTSRQSRLLRQCRTAYRKKTAEIEAKLKVEEMELSDEVAGPNPDMGRLDTICRRIGALTAKRLKVKITSRLLLEKKILTPRQVEKLRSIQDGEEYGVSQVSSKN
jgi:hypothetical protein